MKLAENQRALVETSSVKADNAYREAMGLSPQQSIQLDMQWEVCGEQGKAACAFIQNGWGSADLRPRQEIDGMVENWFHQVNGVTWYSEALPDGGSVPNPPLKSRKKGEHHGLT